jgi:hypothetical protein
VKENAKHRSRRVREAHGVQSTNAVGEPALPPEFAIFAWLLDPERRETMRRRFIDGKGGAMERRITEFATQQAACTGIRIHRLEIHDDRAVPAGGGE